MPITATNRRTLIRKAASLPVGLAREVQSALGGGKLPDEFDEHSFE